MHDDINNGYRVIWDKNRPTLLAHGQDTVPLVYALSDFPGADSRTYQAYRNIHAFGENGIHLVACDINLATGWFKEIYANYEGMKAELSYVLDANPNAKILIRLHVNPPYWWLRDHPEELMVYRDEKGDHFGIDNGESDRMIRGDKDRLLRVSTASDRWKQEAGDRLRGFLKFVEGTPEGDALMGIQIAYGLNGEWHQMGTDVSPVMQTYFRRYLHDLYNGDEAMLQEAWQDTQATFDNAAFHPETFAPTDDGLFRDPKKSRHIMDAQHCIQYSNIDAILHFCKIVKEAGCGKILAGTFYGYYMYAGGDNATISGHLMADKLYEAKGIVDFMSGPVPYTVNRKPECVPMQRGLLESSRLNGMLWLTEMDQAPEDSLQYPCGGNPEKIDTSIAVMRRNILMTVLAGEGAWFYDHRVDFTERGVYRKCGWWDHPALMNQIGKLRALTERCRKKAYKPVADVLLVYDTEQFYVHARMQEKQYEVYAAFMRNGVMTDTVYMSDLEKCDLERYRVICFTNAYLLTPAQRKMIRQLTKGKQVLWLDMPGYCDGDSLAVQNITYTTGLEVEKGPPTAGFTPEPPCENVRVEEDIRESGYRIRIVDTQAQVLARYDDGSVCAARKGDQWYFATPMLTEVCVLPILQAGGAHRYCTQEGISVLADGGTVLLYTNNDGEKTLTLRNGKQIKACLKAFTSWVVDAETGEQLI